MTIERFDGTADPLVEMDGTGGYYPLVRPNTDVMLSSDAWPSEPSTGQEVYQTDTGFTYIYNGMAWVLKNPSTVTDDLLRELVEVNRLMLQELRNINVTLNS